MAEQIRNPFEDEQPKIVHLEKDESHYEVCRMQMHEINRIHKRTFFCNMALCIVVCFLAMFQQTIAGFDPGRTNLWYTGCGASCTAGYPRWVRISAESI